MSRVDARPVVLTQTKPRAGVSRRIVDYVSLSKPRIAILELVVVGTCAFRAAPTQLGSVAFIAALLGTVFVAASASAFNQWIERKTDATMPRTADRPLPSRRLSEVEVLSLAVAWLLLGSAILLIFTTKLAFLFAFTSWLVYVLLYTPMKYQSTHNTFVGAIAGALPALIGWTAVGGALNLTSVSIATILFLWQFPHFMAIAWLYREEYRAAGIRMLSVVDSSGFACGRQAVMAAMMLLPVGLLPLLGPWTNSTSHWLSKDWLYAFGSLFAGAVQAAYAISFMIRRDTVSARRLLKMSLIYLPFILLLLLLTV